MSLQSKKLKLNRKVDLNIGIDVDVLTAGTVAELVNSILEILLYQRNQIPFVYKTYKYYVNRWLMDEGSQGGSTTLFSFQLERQRVLAKKTMEAINQMRKLIASSFDRNKIKSIRFLFGDTAFTPKEAYTVHIPMAAISSNHCYMHHRMPNAKLDQIFISLLTNQELYKTFSNHLFTTNLYLEMEILDDCPKQMHKILESHKTLDTHLVFAKDFYQLPASCKDINIYLQHTPHCTDEKGSTAVALQCCHSVQIFLEDTFRLNINKKTDEHEEEKKTTILETFNWWEAENVVRGFKERITRKGRSIWQQ